MTTHVISNASLSHCVRTTHFLACPFRKILVYKKLKKNEECIFCIKKKEGEKIHFLWTNQRPRFFVEMPKTIYGNSMENNKKYLLYEF